MFPELLQEQTCATLRTQKNLKTKNTRFLIENQHWQLQRVKRQEKKDKNKKTGSPNVSRLIGDVLDLQEQAAWSLASNPAHWWHCVSVCLCVCVCMCMCRIYPRLTDSLPSQVWLSCQSYTHKCRGSVCVEGGGGSWVTWLACHVMLKVGDLLYVCVCVSWGGPFYQPHWCWVGVPHNGELSGAD